MDLRCCLFLTVALIVMDSEVQCDTQPGRGHGDRDQIPCKQLPYEKKCSKKCHTVHEEVETVWVNGTRCSVTCPNKPKQAACSYMKGCAQDKKKAAIGLIGNGSKKSNRQSICIPGAFVKAEVDVQCEGKYTLIERYFPMCCVCKRIKGKK